MATRAELIQTYAPSTYSKCWPSSGMPPADCMGPGGEVDRVSRQLCSDASIYYGSNFCKNWCADTAANPGGCPGLTTSIPTYCNTAAGFARPECQLWCKERPGYCNTGAQEYCAANPNAQICACINSEMNKVTGLIPECHDAQCRNYGYKTYTPSTIGGCPDYIDCNTSLQIKDVLGDVDLTGVTIEQNCGDGGGGGTSTDIDIDSGTTSNVSLTDKLSQEFGITQTMMTMIVVTFIILIIAGLLIAFGSIGDIFYEGGSCASEYAAMMSSPV